MIAVLRWLDKLAGVAPVSTGKPNGEAHADGLHIGCGQMPLHHNPAELTKFNVNGMPMHGPLDGGGHSFGSPDF